MLAPQNQSLFKNLTQLYLKILNILLNKGKQISWQLQIHIAAFSTFYIHTNILQMNEI